MLSKNAIARRRKPIAVMAFSSLRTSAYTRRVALVALRWLQPEPSEAAHAGQRGLTLPLNPINKQLPALRTEPSVACNLIRNSLALRPRQPPASKDDRMNNVLEELRQKITSRSPKPLLLL